MVVELIAPDDRRWSRLLERTPHDVYHLPGYGPLYERDAVVEERALYVEGRDGELLLPLLLKPLPSLGSVFYGWRDASSPYGYPGPLMRGTLWPDEAEPCRAAIRELLLRERVVSCFLRCNPLLPEGDAWLAPLGTVVEHGPIAL